jgi:beta-mannosidase
MARERIESLSRQLVPSSSPPKSVTSSYRRSTTPLDKRWVFRQADGDDSAQTFRTTSMFPTNIHLDLLLHGLIPDPFVSTKEKETQWVGEKTWIYKCSFQVAPHSIKRLRGAVMVFDGLDTFAKVKLDGRRCPSEGLGCENRRAIP